MTIKHEIAHVAHVELLTPEPDKSLWFFTRIMGLTEVGTEGDSVYLRTWDDYEHHTLKLTAHSTSGIRRTGLRASSREALPGRPRSSGSRRREERRVLPSSSSCSSRGRSAPATRCRPATTSCCGSAA